MFARAILIVLASFTLQNEAARILVFVPTPAISHQVVFRPLVNELVNRGHEVVHLTTNPAYKDTKIPAKLTEIDVQDLSYGFWREQYLNTKVTSGEKSDLKMQVGHGQQLLHILFEKQMMTSEMQAIMKDKSKTFDLIIVEAFYMPLMALTHRFNAPVIQLSTYMAMPVNMDGTALPWHPVHYPSCVQQKFINLTLWEKIEEAYNAYQVGEIHVESGMYRNVDFLKRLFGPDVPSLKELSDRVDLLFLNVFPGWDSNRPVPPNVIYIGGIHQQPATELPKDLKTYLDSSKNGVIYISFGTNIDTASLPQDKIQAIIKAFSKLPYDVLWKWNNDELPGKSDNIRISKWLPQSDLMNHPNVKLFITQGGLQSTDEAINAGLPMIGIPMLGDQWYNAEMYLKHKIGLRVDIKTLTADKIENAILTIMNDKSYYDNIKKLKTIIHDTPQSPLKRAIWWTEYLLRHGSAKHLRSPASNMSWIEYFEVELISYILAGILSVVTIVLFAIYFVCSRLFCGRAVQPKLKNK